MLFLFVKFKKKFTSKSHLSVNGWVSLVFFCFFFNCYLDSSNKINCISALFFEQIYILSLPIIYEFLWSVVVSTVSPVKLHGEDELKIQQKALKCRENTQFLCESLLAGCIK